MNNTIFALSSAPGRAGIAIFRLSGPQTPDALRALLKKEALPSPRQALLARFWDGEKEIDRGIVLYFPAPSSYTGEDMAEFHVHGGPAIIAAMSNALKAQAGLRPAEPGEFSRRAFDGGKLDLSEIEGLADLIAAETEEQRRQSLRQAGGALSHYCQEKRSELLRLQARIEAMIDFPEEDLPPALMQESLTIIDRLIADLSRSLTDRQRGEILRRGYRIVLLGPPNAGKSSLLNYLAAREVAIVSHEPGTTRDVLEVALDLGGYQVLLTDTAGLRETDSLVEQEGIRRAKKAAAAAQLRLYLAEREEDWPQGEEGVEAIGGEGGDGEEKGDGEKEDDGGAFYLLTKVDLRPASPSTIASSQQRRVFPISVTSGQGVEALIQAIAERVQHQLGGAEEPIITRARHRAALEETLAALKRARLASLPELLAEEIRLAQRALGRILGQTDVEAMLDLLFREFCIGK